MKSVLLIIPALFLSCVTPPHADLDVVELRQLAEQGDAKAQFNLGWMYAFREGISEDDREAVKWYTLAAEQGYVSAQFYLGRMYYYGEGVLGDNVYAYMWWNIASSQGDEMAKKNKGILAKEMTSSQIAEAQKLSKQCLNSNYKDCD